MKADVQTDTKTYKSLENAETDQAKNGDSCSAQSVQAGPTSLTIFGMRAKLSALPRRDDVLVDKGAAVPKPCLSPAEMRTLKAAGGLRPAGKASRVTRTILYQSLLLVLPN